VSLRRHEIARELLADVPQTGPTVEVACSVTEVSHRFDLTFSTVATHVRQLMAEGVVVSTKPVIIDPNALATVDQARPRLRLVTSDTAPLRSVPTPVATSARPVDALVHLGEVAIRANNLDALALIVDALQDPTAPSRPDRGNRDPNRDSDRENRDSSRDFLAQGSIEDEGTEELSIHSPSSHRDLTAKIATPDRETTNTQPPPSGDIATDKAIAEMLSRSPLAADADATPQWIRTGALDATTWTKDDYDRIAGVYKAATGHTLSRRLRSLLQIWSPTEAANAITAVASDTNVRSPGGQLATAATLGYHRYFPLNLEPPLPHWDLWCTTRTTTIEPADLRRRLESFSGIAGTPQHLIRVAATLAAHPDQIPTATAWDFLHLDTDTITDTIARYEKATP